jgi:hypothetical protein
MSWGIVIEIIVIIIATIIVQYLFNPYLNRMGLRREEPEEIEVDREKEEEFYREIWDKKRN